MKTKTIKQTINFKATPQQVYELIMDAKKHSAFTGGPVKMSTDIKGEFSIFNGYCTGYNIELEKDKKIVQTWNFGEEGWTNDHYSICTFEFTSSPNGTELTFTQSGVPEQQHESLTSGWKEHYWEPMAEYLAEAGK